MLSRFIEQLTQELEEKVPTPGEDGVYTLNFEPKLEILLRENRNSGITFLTKLAPVPTKNKEEFLLKIMCANLFGKETAGSILGLDSEGKICLLRRFLDSSAGYKNFKETLEDFTNYADVWREEILAFEKEAAEHDR